MQLRMKTKLLTTLQLVLQLSILFWPWNWALFPLSSIIPTLTFWFIEHITIPVTLELFCSCSLCLIRSFFFLGSELKCHRLRDSLADNLIFSLN
jgi:hypothetical protein